MSVRVARQSRTDDRAKFMHWRCAFSGSCDQVAAARRLVAALLGDAPVRDDAVLIASELTTNAVQHTRSGRPGGSFIVTVIRWPNTVLIAVTDQGGPGIPTAAPADDMLAAAGRGIPTVASVASDWGWHGNPLERTVWAEVTVSPSADPPPYPIGPR